MSNFSDQVSFIRDKVLQLITDNQNLKLAYDDLSLQLEALQEEQKLKDEKIKLLGEQIKAQNSDKEKKVVNVTSEKNSSSRVISQKEINKMIKEIDECLALLDI